MAAHHSIAAVQPVNPLQLPDWDARLATHPEYSFFHSAAWARVLAGTYGYTPAYFLASEAGGLPSLLPVMEVDSWLTGRRGIALPFTDDCEPLYADADSGRRLVQGALAFGKTRGWKYLECRGGRELFDDASASLCFYGHVLNLSADEAGLFARCESSVRRAIRKAEKQGVTVTVSQDLAAVRDFYLLQGKTRQKHGLPPQPFSFFRNIHEHVLSRNLGVVVVARYQQQPVAASVFFQLGGRAIYKFGASDETFQHLRGSNLVMWEAIKWHARRGFQTLDFGRTSLTNEGLRYFKLGWGAAEKSIEYVKYDLRNARFVTDTDESSGWHNRIFKVMPGFLARMIGTLLYRHWA